MKRLLLLSISVVASLFLSGCGNYDPLNLIQLAANGSLAPKTDQSQSSAAPPPSFTPSPATLQSIAITPQTASIPLGRTEDYSAIGTYSDGSTRDITSTVQWRVEPFSLGFFSGARFQARDLGPVAIIATLQERTATASLQIRRAEPTTLAVTPQREVIGIGSIQDFVPNGLFTDGLSGYPTPIECRVSDTAIATIVQVGENHCRVQGLSAGEVTVSLASYGLTALATLDVLPLTPFNSRPFISSSTPAIGIDDSGGEIIISNIGPNGEILWSRRSRGGAWSALTAIDATPSGGWGLFVADVSRNGSALIVGSGSQGIFSVRYSPGQGWQGLETVSRGAVPDPLEPAPLQVGYDAAGNGLAAWSDGQNIVSAEYHSGSGWSAPAVRGAGLSPALAMNESGTAVLVWEKHNALLPRAGFTIFKTTPYAASYRVGSGWSPPVVLDTFEFAERPSVVINEAGEAFAVWKRFQDSNDMMTARRSPNGNWTAPQPFSDPTTESIASMAIDEAGNVIALTNDRKAYRYVVGSGWETAFIFGSGTPTQLKFDRNGNALATVVGANSIDLWRYHSSLGWGPAESFMTPRVENFKYLGFAMNAAGEGVISWEAFFQLWSPEEKVFKFNTETYIETVP